MIIDQQDTAAVHDRGLRADSCLLCVVLALLERDRQLHAESNLCVLSLPVLRADLAVHGQDPGLHGKQSGTVLDQFARGEEIGFVGDGLPVTGLKGDGDAELRVVVSGRPQSPEAHFVQHGGNHAAVNPSGVALMPRPVAERRCDASVGHVIEWRLNAELIVQTADDAHPAVALLPDDFHVCSPIITVAPLKHACDPVRNRPHGERNECNNIPFLQLFSTEVLLIEGI